MKKMFFYKSKGYLIFVFILAIIPNISTKFVKAKLESCGGCSLNRAPEVKAFAYEDLPKYNIEFKKIHGALPELIFYDENDSEVERHLLSKLSRKECNDLLLSRGFQMKDKEL